MSIGVHGHRGARARRPENSVQGFEYAIRCGADALEMDLVVTGDNLLVISHDPIAERGAAPTLDEVFELAKLGPFQYDLEIKTWFGPPPCPAPDVFAGMVIGAIRNYQIENRVMVMSFDFQVLQAVRQWAPQIRIAALTENDPCDFQSIAKKGAGAETIAPHLSLVTPAKVAAAHAAGLQVVAWTANLPDQWESLIGANVNGIITDDPAALIDYLRSRGLRS
jgi:glycerophosphoryl diester phosphodiesterase